MLAKGDKVLSLAASNPTAVGLNYDIEAISRALGNRKGAFYFPDALGMEATRIAVSQEMQGLYSPEDLILTASTSEAYSFLFKLLCSPGDQVLVPQPSYPLFEHLTRLEGIEAVPYSLCYANGWQISLQHLSSLIQPRVKAILVVNPNNPTGQGISKEELLALGEICQDKIALIGDEVFFEYPFAPGCLENRVAHLESDCLVFGLGGLSKWIGMPQMKLAWIGISGPAKSKEKAKKHLECITDMYLSVSTPIQVATPDLLQIGRNIRSQIQDRVCSNRSFLKQWIQSSFSECTCLEADGGWYAVIQVPSVQSEEAMTLCALKEEKVFVHPGYFFDFPREAYFVISLLIEKTALEQGLASLRRAIKKLG